ncbi:hypothetical protein ACVXHA_00705 [Escherichia coli]
MTACWKSTERWRKARALAESIEEQDDDTNLIAFAMNLFDYRYQSGRSRRQHDRADAVHLYAGAGLPWPLEDGITITFDCEVALAREDAQFITWEYLLIRNGLD